MRIIGIDYGDSRVGVAVCDATAMIAVGVCCIFEKNMQKVIEKVNEITKEYAAQKIVIGYPKNMNGSIGERGEKTEIFARLLMEKTGKEVALWDERLTTVSANKILNERNVRGKQRKTAIDTVAACIMLQSYLDSLV